MGITRPSMKAMRASVSKRVRVGIAIVAVAAIGLAGCSGNGGAAGNGKESVAQTVPGLPGVAGNFGELPTIEKGSGNPPTELKERVLVKGTGPAVSTKDLVTVNYLGQTWQGEVFDKSFGRGPATFPLTGVIKGWTQGLNGKHVGDRVELVIPPSLGYGAQAQASIPANSTLVFVVDILGKVDPNDDSALKQAQLVKDPKLPAGLKITGNLGAEPKIETSPTFKMPAKEQTVILAQGKGKALGADDQVLINMTTKNMSTGQVESTYTGVGPQMLPQKIGDYPDLLTVFTGVPVGSRILYLKPAVKVSSSAPETPATIMVIDVVASVATK